MSPPEQSRWLPGRLVFPFPARPTAFGPVPAGTYRIQLDLNTVESGPPASLELFVRVAWPPVLD